MKIFHILFSILGFGLISYAAFAADQVKTTESIIGSSDTAVSTNQSYLFNLYIGDNLTGVPNPVKSLHFTASGVYTGTGSITFMIDADAGTSKTFTLPNVGATPTPFELDYKDTSGKIAPISAGTYSYTLNFNPSGVTIYGLGVRMTESHRYVPPACADGSPSNEKIKTTETLVANSNVIVSTNQSYLFNLYIGDNLTGVPNPVKSLHFTASGVYTGTGSITFMIDADAGTSKTFTLPNVGATPTPFELDYKDTSGKIAPISAGTYSYTLNFNPSGVTIYGLGIKMTETHRYKPPACGGMPAFGILTSAVFDSTGSADGAGYNSVMWKGTLGGPGSNEGKVGFQFSASDSAGGPWTYIGGATCASGDWFDAPTPGTPVELVGLLATDAELCRSAWNNKRYFRYKIRICSNNCTDAGTYTPTVEDVVVNWAP